LDIRVRVNLAFFLENWALFGSSQALQFWHHQKLLLSLFSFSRAASTELLKMGQKEPNFSKKNDKFTLVSLMSNHDYSDYKFRFYTSRMNESCLHCHWLHFSSFILSFGHCGTLRTHITAFGEEFLPDSF